ncbi:hypothetical protein [Enterovirga rhinocerotis]|uniref:hypothetical protein n=1 Tax=Enterovirga rhinocerotis TaxID=1339210 RepID=UPI00105F1440|nr:hypothetical protein [Enterovirga rhinocerotis]
MGLAPVWMGRLISIILSSDTLSASLVANLARGDLFLGATTIVAPVALYLTAKSPDMKPPFTVHFPGGIAYLVGLIILFTVSVILFVIKRLKDMSIISSNIQEELFLITSSVLFGFSVLLAYFVAMTRFRIDQADTSMFRDSQDEFNAQWKGRDR